MENFESFADSFSAELPEYLEEVRGKAVLQNVPVIRRSAVGLLSFFVRMTGAVNILEVGTGTGFSALTMWEASGRKAHIITIENYEPRIKEAKINLQKEGAGEYITLLAEDATEVLKRLDTTFDMIFMDAAKGQYENWLPDVKRLLKKGGILITDNILQDGDMLKARSAVRRRDRTIHKRMQDYIFELTHDKELDTILLNSGDGMAVSGKKD